MAYLTDVAAAPTPAEKDLRTAFRQGNRLDLNPAGRRRAYEGVPVHDARRLIHGPVLREVLLSAPPSPTGHVQQLTIIGADIVGPFDLRFAKIDCPIRLENCWFYGPMTLSEAVLRSVSLRDSWTQQTIDATHVRVTGDLILDGVEVAGPLKLGGAHLEDDLHLAGATIHQPAARNGPPDGEKAEPALLDLENLEIKGSILADHLTVEGRTSMNGAAVGGTVQLNDAALGQVAGERPVAVAWSADGLRVAGELRAKKMRAIGQVSLVDAEVQSLVLRDVHVESVSRAALVMDRLQCSGSVFCNGEERRNEFLGGIKAIGIKVGAGLYLGKGEVRAPGSGDHGEWAVSLRRARISDDLRCGGAFEVRGRFDIAGAQIGGSVDLGGVTMRPIEGKTIAFDAGRAQIGANLWCATDADAEAFACKGIMGLINARIDGWVEVEEASDGDGALKANGLRVGRSANIRTSGTVELTCANVTENLKVAGLSTLLASGLHVGRDADVRASGTIDLRGSNVAETLTVNLSGLTAPEGAPAADLSNLTAQVLRLEGRPKGRLDLTRTSVHLLSDDPAQWCPGRRVRAGIPAWVIDHNSRMKIRRDQQLQVAKESPIMLDGLVYEDLAPIGDAEKSAELNWRLAWLEAGTERTRMACDADAASVGADDRYHRSKFVPQPYQQLAAVYRRSGRDSDARDILHAMYCRQNSIMHPVTGKGCHPFLRAWNTTQNVAIGYGYRADRAIAWIIVLAAAVTLWIITFDNQAHIGVLGAAILSLGLALPGSGLDKIQRVVEMSTIGHLFALILVLAGLVLGATVLAAIGRMIKD